MAHGRWEQSYQLNEVLVRNLIVQLSAVSGAGGGVGVDVCFFTIGGGREVFGDDLWCREMLQ